MPKRDSIIKDCFKVRKGLCVTGDSALDGDVVITSGGLTVSGIDVLQSLGDHGHIDSQSVFSTVNVNSGGWESGGGGGPGGTGVFITDISSGGITEKTIDSTQVPVGSYAPVISAVVDDPVLSLTVEWEGSSDEWTGYPTISGHEILKNETIAIAGSHARRYRATKTIDFDDYKGNTIDIPVEFKGVTSTIGVQIAGSGPEILDISPDPAGAFPYNQDHYKAGDTISVIVWFNTTDVSSITFQQQAGTANGTQTFTGFSVDSVTKRASIDITCDPQSYHANLTPLNFKAKATNSLGTEGDSFTTSITVNVLSGPVVTGVSLPLNPYPGSQVEFKSGDTLNLVVSFDTTNISKVQFNNSENSTGNDQKNVTLNGNDEWDGTVAISTTLKSNTAGTFSKSIKLRAKGGQSGNEWGEYTTSIDTIDVNDQHPTFQENGVTYPNQQTAIKVGEEATVDLKALNVGNNPIYLYSHPTGQLQPPADIADGTHANDAYIQQKRTQYSSGDYNVSTGNFKLQVTREENGASADKTVVVNIASTAPVVDIISNNNQRMRSGGNDGTSAQNYTIQLDSNQKLASDPTLTVPVGTPTGNWTASQNDTRYTTYVQIHDNDDKGVHTFTGMTVTNMAGMSTTIISSGDTYEVGGFVSRTLNVVPAGSESEMNVLWSTYSKLRLTWSVGVAMTNIAPAGTSDQKGSAGNPTGDWCIADQTVPDTGTHPVTVRMLDYSATGAITAPSTITIEELI